MIILNVRLNSFFISSNYFVSLIQPTSHEYSYSRSTSKSSLKKTVTYGNLKRKMRLSLKLIRLRSLAKEDIKEAY